MTSDGGTSNSARRTSYLLWAIFLFLIIIIGTSGYQIWDINEHGYREGGDQTGAWDFRGYEEYFMNVALVIFGMIIPVILTLLLIPVLIRSFKWNREGYDKGSRGRLVYGMVICFVYGGIMAFFAYGNITDKLMVPGIAAAIGAVLNAVFIISGAMLVLSGPKGP
ncbi:MAG: hypothetical protein ACMUHM_03235 [Thermoplasmatota archaeon]